MNDETGGSTMQGTVVIRRQGPLVGQSVACDVLSNGHMVSTINLDAAPSILKDMDRMLGLFSELVPDRADLSTPGSFETMVFECDQEGEVTNWREQDFRRYSTLAAALAGHEEVVEKWLLV